MDAPEAAADVAPLFLANMASAFSTKQLVLLLVVPLGGYVCEAARNGSLKWYRVGAVLTRTPPGRRRGGAAKGGGAGKPVNSCTMARKLEASVVSTVVGGRRDGLGRFLVCLRATVGGDGSCSAATGKEQSGGRWKQEAAPCSSRKVEEGEGGKSGWSSRKAEASAAVEDGRPWLSLVVEAMAGLEDGWMDGDIGFVGIVMIVEEVRTQHMPTAPK